MFLYRIKSWWKKQLLQRLLIGDVPPISISQAYNMKDSVIFLDTRSQKEYEVSHIKNAIYAGYREFDLLNLNSLAKDQPIIVYCSIGIRSEMIGRKLKEAGFAHVQNLYGGIFEWFNDGLDVVDSSNSSTDKIHCFNQKFRWWLNRGNIMFT